MNTRLSQANNAVSTPFDYLRKLLAGQSLPPPAQDSEVRKLRHLVEELQTRLAQPNKPARRALKRKRRA